MGNMEIGKKVAIYNGPETIHTSRRYYGDICGYLHSEKRRNKST